MTSGEARNFQKERHQIKLRTTHAAWNAHALLKSVTGRAYKVDLLLIPLFNPGFLSHWKVLATNPIPFCIPERIRKEWIQSVDRDCPSLFAASGLMA